MPAKYTPSWARTGPAKARLAQVLAGRELYVVTEGSVTYDGKDLLELDPEERAQAGIFLAFQYPVEIPGVSNMYFLKAALNAVRKGAGQPELDAMDFLTLVRDKMTAMKMDQALLNRPVNTGFSGGEKKRNEIFQMAVLEPRLAILDETDSGPRYRRAETRRRGRQRHALAAAGHGSRNPLSALA